MEKYSLKEKPKFHSKKSKEVSPANETTPSPKLSPFQAVLGKNSRIKSQTKLEAGSQTLSAPPVATAQQMPETNQDRPASSGIRGASQRTQQRKQQGAQLGKPAILSQEELEFFQDRLRSLREQLRSNIIGQEDLLHHLLLALIGGGHILIEGVPGLAKTLAIRSLAQSLQLSCKRIQFTPDLLPADLIGTMIFHQNKADFVPRHGPIFTQVLLADEINRAPAKVQSALLEAMGEQQVTIGDRSYKLPVPFFVMATQNPIEEEGTYPLPAAQLDRFDIKYVVRYPNPNDELQLLMHHQRQELGFQKTALNPAQQNAPYHLQPKDLLRMRDIAGKVQLGESLARYIINIVNATRETGSRLEFSRYLDLGASPRASLALCRYSALTALFSGRDYVLPNDIKLACPAVLRHRLLLSYEAEAADHSTDDVIQQILQTVAVP